jgi:DNA-binding MarR family transcriptional regulator
MAELSTRTYPFGDLLALARQSWITQMTTEVERRGYPGYRRSDAAVLRRLRRSPVSIGQLADLLDVSRQAARKVAATLEQRGFAVVVRDDHDGRQFNVALTPTGTAYARTLADVIDRLNRAVGAQVTPEQLIAADTVLRATLGDAHTRAIAAYLPHPRPSSKE